MAINSLTSTRLTGLASGMDTDTIVKNLMQIEQLKVNRELRARTKLEWKQEAYGTVSSDLKDFQNEFISLRGANSIKSSNTYKIYNVNVTGANSSAVTVTANSEASAGKITINQIKQLAKATTASSSHKVSKGGTELAASNGTQLRDLNFATALEFEEVDGEKVISFAINGETFTFKDTDTLQTMLNRVSSSDANVTMTYSRLTDKFTVTSKEEGAESSVRISNISGNAFGGGGAFGVVGGIHQNGADAIVVFQDPNDPNGAGIEVTRSSNSFSIDGIQYTLNKTTAADEEAIEISLDRDVEASVEKIKTFVDGYNTLIKKLTDLLAEKQSKKEKGYVPLTEDEKADMTEKQIEQWEAIAKKGLLYNDAGLRSLVTNLRNALYETVESAGLNPASIGLKTAGYFDTNYTQGQIALDEDALRAALERDPDQVMNAFISGDSSSTSAESGLITRIDNLMNGYMKGSQATTLETLNRNLTNLDNRIERLEKKMLEYEERLYQKYAAMEEALSQLNSQSDWISSMLMPTTTK